MYFRKDGDHTATHLKKSNPEVTDVIFPGDDPFVSDEVAARHSNINLPPKWVSIWMNKSSGRSPNAIRRSLVRSIFHLASDSASDIFIYRELFEMGRTIPQVASVSGHRSWQSLKRYTPMRQIGDQVCWLALVKAVGLSAAMLIAD